VQVHEILPDRFARRRFLAGFGGRLQRPIVYRLVGLGVDFRVLVPPGADILEWLSNCHS
jgi:hypothetical protein